MCNMQTAQKEYKRYQIPVQRTEAEEIHANVPVSPMISARSTQMVSFA